MKEKTKKPFYKKWWVWAILILLVIGFINQPSEEEKAEIKAQQEADAKLKAEEKAKKKEEKELIKEKEQAELAAKKEEEKKEQEELEKKKKQEKELAEAKEKLEAKEKRKAAEQKSKEKEIASKAIISTPKNSEKDYYERNVKNEITEITKEYDAIWDEEWKPTWEEINKGNSNIASLATSMTAVTDRYSVLSKKISGFKQNGLNDDHSKLLEDYRLNFSKAISYRGNAGRAITQAINGVADLKSRVEEAKRSIELADKYMLKGVASLAELEQKLNEE